MLCLSCHSHAPSAEWVNWGRSCIKPIQAVHLLCYLRQILLLSPYRTGITLAVGDGANDVPMIQGAHVGIGRLVILTQPGWMKAVPKISRAGIRGKEGNQAVQAVVQTSRFMHALCRARHLAEQRKQGSWCFSLSSLHRSSCSIRCISHLKCSQSPVGGQASSRCDFTRGPAPAKGNRGTGTVQVHILRYIALLDSSTLCYPQRPQGFSPCTSINHFPSSSRQ